MAETPVADAREESVAPSRWSRALMAVSLPRHTERLLLRPVELDDAPAIAAYEGLAEVARYLGREPRNEAEVLAALRETLGHHRADSPRPTLELAAVERSSDTLVGTVHLRLGPAGAHPSRRDDWRHGDARLGYVIDPRFQGRGYAREAAADVVRVAVDEIGVRKLSAMIFAEHAASIAVARAIGLRHEYTVRSAWMSADGRWLDDDAWSMFGADQEGQ